jgi:putative ABC transport system permease protein
MEEVAGEELVSRKQSMTLLSVFAGIAMLLAVIGIYGVLSYTVSQRSREIAVRVAMGAMPARVIGLIAGRALLLTGVGVAIGVVVSLAATRLLHTLLFGVRENDPWILITVTTALACVAAGACLIPALRASRIDPSIALRND